MNDSNGRAWSANKGGIRKCSHFGERGQPRNAPSRLPITNASSVVADSAVWTAGAQTFEVQKIACEYVTKINFQPTFRSESDKGRYGHLLTGIKSTAALNQTRADPSQSRVRQAWTRFKNLF